MIQLQSVLLVIDTNVLADIMERTETSRVDEALKRWIQNVLDGMERRPKERRITVLVSTAILGDYKAGLCGKGYREAAETIRSMTAKKQLSNVLMLPHDRRIKLSLSKIRPDAVGKSVSDKYDRPFLGALKKAKSISKWKDYAIIFASRDKRSREQIKDEIAKSAPYTQLDFPTNVNELAESIAC